jgi:putative nucleotidyltransferase with HDIG domain
MMHIRIPDVAHCFRLMDEYAMLPNIRRHSVMVARVALQLMDGLAHNERISSWLPDRDLVAAGALLHDIAKTPCLQSGDDHARAGAEICERLGYPEIARIVAEHVVLRDHDRARNELGKFTAREIIYYADKRVRHEEIVSLQERLVYILERYGAGEPEIERRIRENFAGCVQLENSLFSFLSFVPAQLAQLVPGHREGAPLELFPAGSAVECSGRVKGEGQVRYHDGRTVTDGAT